MLLNYKSLISKYLWKIGVKTFSFQRECNDFRNLLANLSSPALIINEYGTLVNWNAAFFKYFPAVMAENANNVMIPQQNTIEKICGQQFFEQIIELIKFMQENDQISAYKERFLTLTEEDRKTNCDIAAYQLKATEGCDLEFENEMRKLQPNFYLLTLNLRYGDQKCSETFSHDQRIKTLGYLSGAISHDFNNILTAISGFIEIILDRTQKSNANYEDLIHIKNSVGKAINLVDRLLAFARKQVLNFEVIDVAAKFQEINQLMQRLIGNEVELQLKIQKKLHYIEVDPVQFEQIILNLALNAKQAITSKVNGAIKINVANKEIKSGALFQKGYFNPSSTNRLKPGRYVKISVKDNGCGIKRSFLHQIFDPFFSTRKKKNGTGLGLSTVFGIINQSKGHIFVHSKDKYTEFIILFPKSNKYVEAKPIRKKIKAVKVENSNKNIRILVIEDEEGIRALLEKALKAHKYHAVIFENADEAVSSLEETGNYNFDIVITDVIMPGTNGPEFLEYFRKHNSSAQAIMISGYGKDFLNTELIEKENVTFLPKPFSIKKLINKLDSIKNVL